MAGPAACHEPGAGPSQAAAPREPSPPDRGGGGPRSSPPWPTPVRWLPLRLSDAAAPPRCVAPGTGRLLSAATLPANVLGAFIPTLPHPPATRMVPSALSQLALLSPGPTPFPVTFSGSLSGNLSPRPSGPCGLGSKPPLWSSFLPTRHTRRGPRRAARGSTQRKARAQT